MTISYSGDIITYMLRSENEGSIVNPWLVIGSGGFLIAYTAYFIGFVGEAVFTGESKTLVPREAGVCPSVAIQTTPFEVFTLDNLREPVVHIDSGGTMIISRFLTPSDGLIRAVEVGYNSKNRQSPSDARITIINGTEAIMFFKKSFKAPGARLALGRNERNEIQSAAVIPLFESSDIASLSPNSTHGGLLLVQIPLPSDAEAKTVPALPFSSTLIPSQIFTDLRILYLNTMANCHWTDSQIPIVPPFLSGKVDGTQSSQSLTTYPQHKNETDWGAILPGLMAILLFFGALEIRLRRKKK